MTSRYQRDDLVRFAPRHATLIGIDSDGCVFPTMAIKQKQCFHGEIVAHWKLQPIERAVRECAEFVNLHSTWRGTNRFAALLRTFDVLAARPEAQAAGVALPERAALRQYVASGVPLSHATLAAAVERTGDPELRRVLAWSQAVNANVERLVKRLPPFRGVRESLERLARDADVIVVSQTPEEALIREWAESGLDRWVALIAGQELGTKAEHIGLTARGRYAPERILVIGDALGDLRAARANGACFYPIDPDAEEASWQRFRAEACDRFLGGTYAGAYEAALIAAFERRLPEKPPWEPS